MGIWGASDSPPSGAGPGDSRHSLTKPSCPIPRATTLASVKCLSLVLLPLAILVFITSCGSLRLNPDPDVAPSGDSARVWPAPPSITIANQSAPKLAELRSIDESKQLPQLNLEYDLPGLVDLPLT